MSQSRESTIPSLLVVSMTAALLLVACESGSGSPDSGAGVDNGSAVDNGAAATCSAQVVIGFFTDDACTVPVAVGSATRTYDTSLSCFGWAGSSAAGENSATNFQCYRDRLCYTQHPGRLDCVGGSFTDKQARTDECVLDTDGGGSAIYARIVSGTESCPVAPAGFECPSSAPGAGTDGIRACTNAP